MRVRWLQHVPFEGLGTIEAYLVGSGHFVQAARLYDRAALPSTGEFDWLIVMGGPMGVRDEVRYPWLVEEKRLIERAIRDEKRVLGICLGAQLIANVLGAPVYPNGCREIGWYPVTRAPEAEQSPFGSAIPPTLDAFHWHGDTFDLPTGAVHLAASAACARQAFSYGPRVLALQFHLESTPESVASLIENCPGDLDSGPCAQAADAMLSDEIRFARIAPVLEGLVGRLAVG
ncbi:MAG: amidotransferase [Planctomycetes bacterium]|nr:amidotransferase [Planctomycetota bacterium]